MSDLEKDISNLENELKTCSNNDLIEGYKRFCKAYKRFCKAYRKSFDKYGGINKAKEKNLLTLEGLKLMEKEFSARNLDTPDCGIRNFKLKNVELAVTPLYDLLLIDIASLNNEELMQTYKTIGCNLNKNSSLDRYTFWDFMQPLLIKELTKRGINIEQPSS